MKLTPRRRAGGLIVVASLAVWCLCHWWYASPILDRPIVLHRGEVRAEFTARRGADYVILLRFRNRIGERRLNAMLGQPFPREDGRRVPSLIKGLSWSLWSRGQQTAQSDPGRLMPIEGPRSGDIYGLIVGRVYVTAGEPCVLFIDFPEDPTELNQTNPRLVLRPTGLFGGVFSSGPHDSWVPVLNDLWTMAALVLGLILLFGKQGAKSPSDPLP